MFHIFFRIFGRKLSDYGWKVFDSVVGIAFHGSSQRVYQIGFFERSFTFIGLGAKGSRTSSRKFPAGLSELLIRVQKIILRRDLLYGRIIFPKLFLDQECKLFALPKIFFGWVSKHKFNMSGRLFGEKIFGKSSIKFCHNVWTISKNDLACWREKFIILVLLTIKFRISWNNFAGSSELNSTRSRFCNERNNILWAVKTSWWIVQIQRKVPQAY